jgi:hypothetical protein
MCSDLYPETHFKSTVFWDVTLCSPVNFTDEEHNASIFRASSSAGSRTLREFIPSSWCLLCPVLVVSRVSVDPWPVGCWPESRILRRGFGQETEVSSLSWTREPQS